MEQPQDLQRFGCILRKCNRREQTMGRVTVMMFRDMVESVMLLKEDACGGTQ